DAPFKYRNGTPDCSFVRKRTPETQRTTNRVGNIVPRLPMCAKARQRNLHKQSLRPRTLGHVRSMSALLKSGLCLQERPNTGTAAKRPEAVRRRHQYCCVVYRTESPQARLMSCAFSLVVSGWTLGGSSVWKSGRATGKTPPTNHA